MFAFAIWDREQSRLFCARDRAGEKPFHYASASGSFGFASELKALLPWPGLRKEIDWTAVADFLTFGFIPDPKTIWDGVKKLPPGHWLEVDLAEDATVSEPVPYWDFELDPDESVDDWGQAIRDTLERAAAEMTVSDVPVGMFLSGGVDSSSVAAALARAGQPLTAYTIGFEEGDYDESAWATLVAESYGIPHVRRKVGRADVDPASRKKVLWHYDEPFNDQSYLPTYLVSREARRSITVALSGDGGDETFAGYRKYRQLAKRAGVERGLSRPVTQLVAAGAQGILPAESRLRTRFQPYRRSHDELVLSMLVTGIETSVLRQAARGPLAQALSTYDPLDAVRPHVRKAPPAEVGLVDSMRYVDLKTTLACGILTKVDRASMAVSLETRPVYLHREMLDLARRIPGRRLATGREAKTLLKQALEPWLPSALLHREKMGFAMPLGDWLRAGFELGNGNGDRRPVTDVLDAAYLEETHRQHLAGSDRTTVLHAFSCLDQWLEQWA